MVEVFLYKFMYYIYHQADMTTLRNVVATELGSGEITDHSLIKLGECLDSYSDCEDLVPPPSMTRKRIHHL